MIKIKKNTQAFDMLKVKAFLADKLFYSKIVFFRYIQIICSIILDLYFTDFCIQKSFVINFVWPV